MGSDRLRELMALDRGRGNPGCSKSSRSGAHGDSRSAGRGGVECHVEDSIEDGKLKFDSLLEPGVVRTGNALSLMQGVGLEVKERE